NPWLRRMDSLGLADPYDYEPLFIFLRKLRDQTGSNYRVSWAGAYPYVVHGFPTVTAWVGSALLFNADRLQHVTGSGFGTEAGAIIPWDDYKTTGPQLRASHPCAIVPPDSADLCKFIDQQGYVASPYRRLHHKENDLPSLPPNDDTWLLGSTAGAFSLDNGDSVFVYHNGQIDPRGYTEAWPAVRGLPA